MDPYGLYEDDDDEEDMRFEEAPEEEQFGEDSVDEDFSFGRVRVFRLKEDKTRFVAKDTFTADEMVNLLEPIPEPERSEVGRELFVYMKLAIDKTKKEEEGGKAPSMWDYDRRSQPKEFAEHFWRTRPYRTLLSRNHILNKICEKLPVSDFLRLSLTCRYLHWRMFIFCTCHAPYSIRLQIADRNLADGLEYQTLSKEIYHDGKEFQGRFVLQPACLKKPFFFKTGIFYRKEDFDRCLPFVLPIRKLTKEPSSPERMAIASQTIRSLPIPTRTTSSRFVVFLSSDGPFQAVKATSVFYRRTYCNDAMIHAYLWYTCPYTRKFNSVWVPDEVVVLRKSCDFLPFRDILPWDSCPNQFGVYQHPPDDVVKQTLHDFFHTSKKLEFHAYYFMDYKHPATLLKYLFGQYNFEEYYWNAWDCSFWTTTIETEGRRHRIAIYQAWRWTDILVVSEETFDKMKARYFNWFFENDDREELMDSGNGDLDERIDGDIWKMETAIEPEDEDGAARPLTEEEEAPDRKRAKHG